MLSSRRRPAPLPLTGRGQALGARGGGGSRQLRSLLVVAVIACVSVAGALRLAPFLIPSSISSVSSSSSPSTTSLTLSIAAAEAAEARAIKAAAAAGQAAASPEQSPSPSPDASKLKDESQSTPLPFHVRLAQSYNAGKSPEDFQLLDNEDGVLLITFATKSASEFLQNWFLHVKAADIEPYVVGALDEDIVELCEAQSVPVVLVNGSEILRQRQANFFSIQSSDFRKYSAVKTAFILSLLERGITPIMSDADVIWMRNPKEYFFRGSLADADILVSSDCVDVPSDKKDDGSCAHINFNTGIMVIRPSPTTVAFAREWNYKIISSTEHWMRDQPAFNLITREGIDIGRVWRNAPATQPRRIFPVGGGVTLGSLPNWLFTNGHTYFVQEAKKYAVDEQVYSVHMTFQHGDSFKYAYGKRQRLREYGLFLVDSDEYYSQGNFLTISEDGATYPVTPVGSDAHSRVGYYYHNREDHLRRMWCYCDNMWANLNSCRTPGAESMHLPFSCPMDHIFNPQGWFDDANISFREPFFLENPRVPHAVRESVAYVRVESQIAPNGPGNSSRDCHLTLGSQLPVEDVVTALKTLDSYRLVELSSAVDLVKGFKGVDSTSAQAVANFMNAKMEPVLKKRNFFCFTEDWEQMGKPRMTPWEPDVVKRDCGVTEAEMSKAGRIHFGKIMNYSDCGCEWGFGTPEPLEAIIGPDQQSKAAVR